MKACNNHDACIEQALHRASTICRDRGLRFSKLRQKVLEIVWASHRSIKAYTILENLKAEQASAEPPTVYRALNFLMENGLVHKLNSLNAYIGCSHPLQHHESYFLICEVCNDVVECYDQRIARAIRDTMDKNHFDSKCVTLEIKGKCQNCQEA